MRGWILYKFPEQSISAEMYEMRQLLKIGRQQKINLDVVTQEQLDLIVNRDDRRSLRLVGEVVPLPDFLLPRRGASTTYFCLAIIRHLERLGVYVVNGASSIETVKDKLYTQQILASSGLPFARTMLMQFPVNVDLVEETLGFPVVIKTVSGTQGKGVFLAETREQFISLMELLYATASDINLVLQEFIADSRGRDLRVITIGGKVIACMQRTAQNGSFKANLASGATASAFKITRRIKELAIEASNTFSLDIAGIDLLFNGTDYTISEVNSAPGFQGIESCHRINVAKEIYSFISKQVKPSARKR